MKSCPTCNRTFEDTMTFCLVDGSILSAPFDPNARRHEVIPRSDSAPPTMMYPPANALKAPTAASVEPPPTAPPETVQAAMSRSSIPVESAIPDTGSHETERPVTPTTQPVQARPASEPNQPPMKTIVAPAPEMLFQSPATSGAQSEPRQTIPAARSQPTSQRLSEGRKPLRLFVIGALVVVIVFAGGLFWLIKHNKAANGPTANSTAQPANTGTKEAAPPAASFAETVNGSEIEMVFVKGGAFVMGSPTSDPGRDQDEGPQTEVTVQSFHMSKYEVTQAQYKALMNANPSSFKGDTLPVDSVSWSDAVEFCRKLSQLTGRQYRLPTEAEWEFAARAGSTESSAGNVEATAWYDANSAGHPHAVGQKRANAFGLYDMNGNLWEWCHSKYKPYPYSATDGREDLQGTDVRVLRGGSFESSARGCRSTYRRRVTPQASASGFRIVLSPS